MSLPLEDSATHIATNAFRDHGAALRRYLIRRISHEQDADDLAQEVFARLLRVQDAELIRNPLAYLLGIATHVVREFWQRRRHEQVVFDSDMTDELCETPGYNLTPGHADQLELQNRLDAALTQLPATHRLVLLLVKRDGLSYAEAARSAGLSVHTIEKYVVEARAKLRIMLSES